MVAPSTQHARGNRSKPKTKKRNFFSKLIPCIGPAPPEPFAKTTERNKPAQLTNRHQHQHGLHHTSVRNVPHKQKQAVSTANTNLSTRSYKQLEDSRQTLFGPFVRFDTLDTNVGSHGEWTGSVLVVARALSRIPTLEITIEDTLQEADESAPNESTKDTKAAHQFPAAQISPVLVIGAHKEYSFWRYNLRIRVMPFHDRKVCVKANMEPQMGGQGRVGNQTSVTVVSNFVVKGAASPLRVAFFSCNDVSSDVTDEKLLSNPDGLWDTILAEHEKNPYHYLVGGGDQLYCDPVWTVVPELSAWLKLNLKNRKLAELTQEARVRIADYYFNAYIHSFTVGSRFAKALKSMPTCMVIDDHDIFDGVGSYDESLRTCPTMNGVFDIGYNFFLLFQQQTNPMVSHKQHNFFGANGSHNFLSQLSPEVALLGMDGRRERTLTRVASQETYREMFEILQERLATSGGNEDGVKGKTKHLLTVLGVPIVYPRLTIAEKMLQKLDAANRATHGLLYRSGVFGSIMGPLGAQPELLDDMADHWTAEPHLEERKIFLESLQLFARTTSIRISFVSGDVHCAGVGLLKGNSPEASKDTRLDPNFMLQVISSAIQNAPPPAFVLHTLQAVSNKETLNSSTDERMMNLFGRATAPPATAPTSPVSNDDTSTSSIISDTKKFIHEFGTSRYLMGKRNWLSIQYGSNDPKTRASTDETSTSSQDDALMFKLRFEESPGSGTIGSIYGVMAPALDVLNH